MGFCAKDRDVGSLIGLFIAGVGVGGFLERQKRGKEKQMKRNEKEENQRQQRQKEKAASGSDYLTRYSSCQEGRENGFGSESGQQLGV
jgi:hypothetical protein